MWVDNPWLKAGPACGLDDPSLGSSASITPPQLKNSVRLQLLHHVILNSCSVRPIRSKSLRAPIFLKRCSSAWVIQALGKWYHVALNVLEWPYCSICAQPVCFLKHCCHRELDINVYFACDSYSSLGAQTLQDHRGEVHTSNFLLLFDFCCSN